MESFSQKYTIVQLLQEMKEGEEYASSDWPLHVTIAGIFAIDLAESGLFERLTDLLTSQKPFTSTAARDEYFGSKKRTHVTILDMNEELLILHYNVVALLKQADATFNTPQFIEEGFRAHATVRPQARLRWGEIVQFNALTVIDMFPNGNPYRRKVLKTIQMQG